MVKVICILVVIIYIFPPIQEDETGSALMTTPSVDAEAAKPLVPVVKAKASSVLMNSLITSKLRISHMNMYWWSFLNTFFPELMRIPVWDGE